MGRQRILWLMAGISLSGEFLILVGFKLDRIELIDLLGVVVGSS